MSNLNDLFKNVSTEHLNNLDLIIRMGSDISTESKALAFIDSTKSKFYDYVERVHSFVKSLTFTSQASPQIDAGLVLERFGRQSYADNRKLLFYVAPGFTGSLPAFLDLMLDKVLPAAESAENSLKITLTRLATLLNEPDRLKAQSGIRDLEHHLVLVPGEDLEKVRGFFKAGSKSQVFVKEVLERNGDLADVYTKTNLVNQRLSKVDFKRVQDLVARLGQLTGALNKALNEGDDGREEVAGSVASQLSDLFYRIGTTLTACSVLIEMMRQHSEAMRRDVDELLAQLPQPLGDEIHKLGCQSTKVRIIADEFPVEMKKLLVTMHEANEIVKSLKGDKADEAERIYDNLCESWYLSDYSDNKAALKQFATDVSSMHHEVKALAA